MHLNKIKTKIGLEIFKIKKNFEILGKLKKNYTLYFTLKKNEPLYDLIYNGYDFHKKLLTDEDINFIIQKYMNKLKLTNDKTKSTSKYGDKFVSKFKKVKLSTTKGNAIILDTQGIHRANVKKGDLRIMLFLKFSSKNNLIFDVDYSENSYKSKLSEYFNFK